jgi:hypothetical protein
MTQKSNLQLFNPLNRAEALQRLFDYCDFDIQADDYDLTQEDGADEAESGGFWDLAASICTEIEEKLTLRNVQEIAQSLLYQLLRRGYADENEKTEEMK